MFENTVDRRSFLRGSALFAVALGLKVASPAAAQAQDQDQSQKPQEKKDPFAGNDEKGKSGEKTYIDQEGREYRICPQCAYNMYKQGRMWVCDNCGYSYVE